MQVLIQTLSRVRSEVMPSVEDVCTKILIDFEVGHTQKQLLSTAVVNGPQRR